MKEIADISTKEAMNPTAKCDRVTKPETDQQSRLRELVKQFPMKSALENAQPEVNLS